MTQLCCLYLVCLSKIKKKIHSHLKYRPSLWSRVFSFYFQWILVRFRWTIFSFLVYVEMSESCGWGSATLVWAQGCSIRRITGPAACLRWVDWCLISSSRRWEQNAFLSLSDNVFSRKLLFRILLTFCMQKPGAQLLTMQESSTA